MAVSKLEIFQTEITPAKNAKIDDIDLYLDDPNFCTKTYENATYQYQKIELNKELKVSVNQENYNGLAIGNYVRITQDGQKFYYFINKSEWISALACKLDCILDTVNSFLDKLDWSYKTTIKREHRDRYLHNQQSMILEKGFFVARPAPGGQNVQYIIKDEQLVGATIESIEGRLIPVEGGGSIGQPQITTFNKEKGELTLTTKVYVSGGTRDKLSGYIEYNVQFFKGYLRIIDTVPEGIDPTLFGGSEEKVIDNDKDDNWYLIYNSLPAGESTNPQKPIQTLLCTDNSIKAKIATKDLAKSLEIIPSDLQDNTLYFLDPFNGHAELKGSTFWGYWIEGDHYYPQKVYDGTGNLVLQTMNSYKERPFFPVSPLRSDLLTGAFMKQGNQIVLKSITFTAQNTQYKTYAAIDITTTNKLTISCDAGFKIFESGRSFPNHDIPNMDFYFQSVKGNVFAKTQAGYSDLLIDGIDSLDRTRSTLIKVVKLPYCPLNYTIDTHGVYNFDYKVYHAPNSETQLQGDFIKLIDNIDFGKVLQTDAKNILAPATQPVNFTPNVNDSNVFGILYEPKLYNSEFYRPKFIYDSFTFDFALENVNPNVGGQNTLKVKYTPSRQFNSAMLFEFPEYQSFGRDTQDFNNVLIANRNNEVPIFDSSYLNYIRTGYNYDVKNKQRDNKSRWVNTGIGFANSAVQAITSIASKNPFTAAEAISTAANAASSIYGNIVSNLAAQDAIDRKLDESAKQSISVSNADSVDLLQAYSGNKAKTKIYKANENVREMLNNLFYYTGYAHNAQSIPNLNTRYWFNYIQCEPVFQGKEAAVYNNFIDDIKLRFGVGITVYHHHADQPKPWDINQEKMNWETNLIG